MTTEFNELERKMLQAVADLEATPTGAYNYRVDGQSRGRASTAQIEIVTKQDQPGIDVIVKPGTKGESVHIPVLLTQSGEHDLVYNDFYIGKGADVTIVAGCGIDNCGGETAQHDGIHTFHLAAGSQVHYLEKHLGTGVGSGGRVLNPVTNIEQAADSVFYLETVQLGGVTAAERQTTATLAANAKLHITERILTTDKQTATTNFAVTLAGPGSAVEVSSRSVAKQHSVQKFVANVCGTTRCTGHVSCDGIMLDQAKIYSTPQISAESVDATLMHEATIGRIAGEQLVKLQTLGLTAAAAEDMILQGFLA